MSGFQRGTSETSDPDTDPGSTSSSSYGPSSGPTSSHGSSFSYSNSSTVLTSTVPSPRSTQAHLSSRSTQRLRYYNATSHSSNPLLDPEANRELLVSRCRESLERYRTAALASITDCHNMVTTLELSRMTGSRVGSSIWFSFWNSMYTYETLQVITSFVRQAQRRIETLFHNTATRLHTMLNLIRNSVRFAATEAQIVWELEIIQEHAFWERERRRRKASRIMEKMRASIQNATYLVIDETKLTDMKRGIFSLDLVCDYYPHSLADGHTAIVLPLEQPEPRPWFQYDPTLDQRRATIFLHNAQHYHVAPGFRPVGNYQLNLTRLA